MTRALSRLSALALLLLPLSCSPAPEPAAAAARPEPPQEEPRPEPSGPAPLEGTAWRLVEIQSMDDRVFTPDDPGRYTVEFGAQGSLVVQADCNRGRGSWVREGAHGLRLGPLALTRMACPAGSLGERFAGNLEQVRSFVEEAGHIFLATMADGAILELERLQAPARPAFDCGAAQGRVELLICDDAKLARLDVELDGLYQRALESYPADGIRELEAVQRGWIKGRNDCWKADDVRSCVEREYDVRITELQIGTGALTVPERVVYACEDGESIGAVFYSETRLPCAVLTRASDDRLIVYLVPAASGSRYEGRNVTFWVKGNEATLRWLEGETLCSVR